MAADKFSVQSSFTVEVADGKQTMPSGIQNLMRNALLGEIITSWGGGSLEGIPIPAQNMAGAGVIGNVLDIDDYNELVEAVAPMLEKVSFSGPNPRGATTRSSS